MYTNFITWRMLLAEVRFQLDLTARHALDFLFSIGCTVSSGVRSYDCFDRDRKRYLF